PARLIAVELIAEAHLFGSHEAQPGVFDAQILGLCMEAEWLLQGYLFMIDEEPLDTNGRRQGVERRPGRTDDGDAVLRGHPQPFILRLPQGRLRPSRAAVAQHAIRRAVNTQ